MVTQLIIVEQRQDWKASFPQLEVITAKDYLAQPQYLGIKNVKVINLCRNYRYLTRGYYCSLLAEARQHKIIPSVKTVQNLSSKAFYSLDIDSLENPLALFNKHFGAQSRNSFEIHIFFGLCAHSELRKLAQQLFVILNCPLLKAEFRHQGKWQISSIKPFYLNQLTPEQDEFFIKALDIYTHKRWSRIKSKPVFRYDLAILHNPQEKLPPSDPEALAKFIDIGKKMGLAVDLIEKKDFARLAEYDALLIRETTNVNHHTYRFAKKAEKEGLVVIDDPNSILRCTNKVFLAELLKTNGVPTPKTLILQKDELAKLERELSYPVVFKIPDGAFSLGVFKAESREAMHTLTQRLFKDSEIVLAQEYLYTSFDWRIGVLNQQAIYACQYFMSEQHWQIYYHDSPSGQVQGGHFRTFALKDVPKAVIKVALKAARLIGDGLYGVDLKQTERGVVVIEVNDNPNIDEGVENAVLKDELYRIILSELIRRLDKRTQQGA